MRITPNNIQDLKPNEVFVFGSNLSGIHGGGAARLAHQKFGAQWLNSMGIQGSSYAIPTKSEGITRSLTIEEIKPFVDYFVRFASNCPSKTFLVTEIGCGLAGHSVNDIAPLFKEAIEIENIHLPERFWEVLKPLNE
jgi:hypothetical protein